jgi:hypothetical protein
VEPAQACRNKIAGPEARMILARRGCGWSLGEREVWSEGAHAALAPAAWVEQREAPCPERETSITPHDVRPPAARRESAAASPGTPPLGLRRSSQIAALCRSLKRRGSCCLPRAQQAASVMGIWQQHMVCPQPPSHEPSGPLPGGVRRARRLHAADRRSCCAAKKSSCRHRDQRRARHTLTGSRIRAQKVEMEHKTQPRLHLAACRRPSSTEGRLMGAGAAGGSAVPGADRGA